MSLSFERPLVRCVDGTGGTAMMRVAFVGCRDWTDRDAIRDVMIAGEELLPFVVITGDASGADRLSADIAREFGLKCVVHRADWDRLGHAAGPERNGRIVADCEVLVAFWDGRPGETLDCILQAVHAGKPVRIVPREVGA